MKHKCDCCEHRSVYDDGKYKRGYQQGVRDFAERFEAYIPNIDGETTMECVENAIKQTLKEMGETKMTCKDCIHYDACKNIFIKAFPKTPKTEIEAIGSREGGCPHFKPKSRFVELPCEVGQTVYKIWSVGRHGKSVAEFVVTGVSQIANNIWIVKYQKQAKSIYVTPTRYQCNFNDFGETVFLTKEEAENALKEREKQ